MRTPIALSRPCSLARLLVVSPVLALALVAPTVPVGAAGAPAVAVVADVPDVPAVAAVAGPASRAGLARTVTVTPRRPMAGETTAFTGRLSPRGRQVRLEVRTAKGWKAVSRSRVGAAGTYRLTTRVRRTATYRVTARGFTSRPVRVATVRQGLTHSIDAPFVVGLPRTVTVTPSPARSGRKVAVQRRTASGWTTLATRRTNKTGVARIPVSSAVAGTHTYRFVALGFRGAPARPSKGVSIRTAPATELVSLGQPDLGTSYGASVSGDGRWVAFTSEEQLLATDTDTDEDIYLFDRRTDALSHLLADADSHVNTPLLSDTGRYLAFQTIASNLFEEGDFDYDVAVLDRRTGAVDLVSATPGGVPGDDPSFVSGISDDGDIVAFESTASDLVSVFGPPDTTVRHAYVHSRSAGATYALDRVSLGWSDDNIYDLTLSADGSRAAFSSSDTALDPGNVAGNAIFASTIAADGAPSGRTNLTPDVDATMPSFDAAGDLLAFTAEADLVPGDTNGVRDTYVLTGPSSYVLAGPVGAAGNPGGVLSDDGRLVALATKQTTPGDTNGGQADIVIWNRLSGASVLVTKAGDGASSSPDLSGDGAVVAYESAAAIVPAAADGFNIYLTALR